VFFRHAHSECSERGEERDKVGEGGREGLGGRTSGREGDTGGGEALSGGAVQEDRVKRVLCKNKVRLKEIVENLELDGDSSLQDMVRKRERRGCLGFRV
jgi:hypothetical protein